jgi:hypothetical protein
MELTKQERKLAEAAAKNYHRFFYRKSEYIAWIGVPILALGILPFFSLPNWIDKALTAAGSFMIIFGCFGAAMSALGKLYEKQNKIDRHFEDDNLEE